jgi:hypothetical protein
MKKLITPILLATIALSGPTAAQASEEQLSQPEVCNQAMQSSLARIQTIKNLKVEDSGQHEFTPEDAPSGSVGRYYIYLSGRGGVDLMKSPKLMGTIAENIIKSCNAAIFTFGQYRSAYGITFGIFEDGLIRQFKCIEDEYPDIDQRRRRGQNIKLPYGYTYCDI